MSTMLRTITLSLLRRLPIRHFVAKSGVGVPFVCHLNDSLGEMPFYNRSTDAVEITAIAEWCRTATASTILDVGANTGFLSSQVLQLLPPNQARIFCFEPVPETFRKLLKTIEVLRLRDRMMPISAALSDTAGLSQMAYDNWDSMLAQVVHSGTTTRVGYTRAWCAMLTVDLVCDAIGSVPTLLKIDVEGSELDVLKGAVRTLQSTHRPALCLEYNPETLSECGVTAEEIMDALSGYKLFFLDDFARHCYPLGAEIADVAALTTPTNLFCVPDSESSLGRWAAVLDTIKQSLNMQASSARTKNKSRMNGPESRMLTQA